MRTPVACDVVVEDAEDEAGIGLRHTRAAFASCYFWFDQKVNERVGYRRRVQALSYLL